MKCSVCETEYQIEDLINWSEINDDFDIYGQETVCPECGTMIWIPSWEIQPVVGKGERMTEEEKRVKRKSQATTDR